MAATCTEIDAITAESCLHTAMQEQIPQVVNIKLQTVASVFIYHQKKGQPLSSTKRGR